MTLLEMIQKENAAAFTHGGKFHADDVFSAALLLHFNPKLTIQRGNRVPGLFLTLEEGSMIITRKTAASGRTERRTRRSAFCGRSLVQKF